MRQQVNVRLTLVSVELLQRLATHYGISQAAVIEILVRERARNVWGADLVDNLIEESEE